ncbi:MAG TPA: hypothetical protein PLC40_00165 [Candidatus Hydrogenedentes bacterium]|nr:hypothetical protein [Candidatus Hydrogenedentota bacterium]
MVVKYYCPKCGRRFVDWGAEKLGFKCPSDTCEEAELVILGSKSSETSGSSQKVKRSKKRKSIVPNISSDIDISEMDDAGFVEDMDLDEGGEGLEEEDEELEDDVVLPVIPDEDEAVVEVIIDTDDDEVVVDEDTFSDALDIEDVELEAEED